MIDIHVHVLPCLDDGAESVDIAIRMLESEIRQGVRAVIATPHICKGYVDDITSIERSYCLLQEEIIDRNLDISLILGNEINVTQGFYELLRSKRFFTLGNTSYILIELNYESMMSDLIGLIYEIRLMGYRPILAHTEFCSYFYDNKKLVRKLIDEGMYVQINASSVLLYKTDRMKRFCNYLLNNNLVTFIASDAHNMDSRFPNLKQCYELIKFSYGKNIAYDLFYKNPEMLLNNKLI